MFAEPVDDKPVIQKVAAPASAGPSPERPFRGEADTIAAYLSGRSGQCFDHRMRVLDAVIHRHLNDRITRLDSLRRRLRSFRRRVGTLRLPVYLQQISAA